MLGEYLLTAALLAGQPPAAAAPAPAPAPAYLPAVQAPAAPAQLPAAQGQAPPLQTMPPEAYPAEGTGARGEPPVEEEKPKYLLERLTEDTWLGQRGIKPYGWVQGSHDTSSASETNRPVAFNDQANEFLLNQLWLGAVKEVDPTRKEFQLGGRAEFFWGSDARFTIPRGLFDYQVRSGELYPFDIYQFYTEAFLPGVGPEGTTVRTGRFATHCSYEVTQGPDTPFLSRSYLFMNNPFTHTGVWAITPLNDDWTISNGTALGSDNFIDRPTNRFTYLGQIKYAPKCGNTTVIFNTVLTDPTVLTDEAFIHYNVYNLQLIRNMSDKLTGVVDTTYSHTDVPGVGYADWYGSAGYLFYKLTDTVTTQLRGELFHDVTGFKTGAEGLYSAVTTGVAWAPNDWLLIRPSVRYDVHDRARPFEGGDKDLFTSTIDAIVRW